MKEQYLIVNMYTFYWDKWQSENINHGNIFDQDFYFKQSKLFCTIVTDEDGKHKLHPENWYKDFYLDDTGVSYLDKEVDEDEQYLCIDCFTLDNNYMDKFKNMVILYLLSERFKDKQKGKTNE